MRILTGRSRTRSVRAAATTALLATAVVAVGALVPSSASAAPAKAIDISADDLGIGNHIGLVGLVSTATVVVPTPGDLAPTRLTGNATLSIDAPDATVEFRIADRNALVLKLKPGETVPFTLPLPKTGEDVVVGLRSLVGYSKQFCNGRLAVPQVDLNDLAVRFDASSSAPTSISTFLPPILRHAYVWVPEVATAAETGAALTLATGLTRIFGAQRVDVSLKSLGKGELPAAHDYDPLVRDFVVRAGAPEGLNLTKSGAAPILTVGGKDPALQAALAISELRRLATGAKADAVGQTPESELPAREQLLSAHGLPITATAGTGQVAVNANVSQADFGGMVQKMTLRVSGQHTPLTGDSNVVVSLLANGKLLTSKKSGSDGRFSFKFDITEPTLQRDNTFTLIATERSPGGACSSDAEPIDLQANGSATVVASMGTSLPQGMRRAPQGFLPSTDLAFAKRDFAEVSSAATLLCALQRLSSQPIKVRVVQMDDVKTSKLPAIIVTASGTRTVPVALPVSVLTGTATTVDLDGNTIKLTPDTPVLQMTSDLGRQVMVLSAGSALQLQTMARALTATNNTLSGLAGDVVVRDTDGKLRDLAVSDASRAPGYIAPDDEIPLWAVGSVGLVVIAILIALVAARRKKRSS